MKKFFKIPFMLSFFLCPFFQSLAAERIESIPHADFNQWVVREIKESGMIGGNTRYIYMVGKGDTLKNNAPVPPQAYSLWGSSNVMANIAGITKATTSVFPEKRGGGYCARLETTLIECKALGFINVKVVTAGAVYLGGAVEPVKNTNSPYANVDMGIPFTKRPNALIFDYKSGMKNQKTLTKATPMAALNQYEGKDRAEVIVFLQHRWEDEKGNIYANRVGTIRKFFDENSEKWVEDHRIEVIYGNATEHPAYQSCMDLTPKKNSFYAKNSSGKIKPVEEIGWGSKDEEITHMVLMISSGSQGIFVGGIGNKFWVDNVRFAY